MTPTDLRQGGDDAHPLERLLDSLVEVGKEQAHVSVSDIERDVGQRSFGPFMFVPAIFEISPLGGIPGVPTLIGLIVVITAAQMLFGRRHFWLPDFISRRSIKGDRIEPAVNKIRPLVRVVDKGLRPRLQRITRRPWNRAVAGLCILCAVIVPPLELIPFASTGPFAAIALIGLGLMAHDGIFVWLGITVAAISFFLIGLAFY